MTVFTCMYVSTTHSPMFLIYFYEHFTIMCSSENCFTVSAGNNKFDAGVDNKSIEHVQLRIEAMGPSTRQLLYSWLE